MNRKKVLYVSILLLTTSFILNTTNYIKFKQEFSLNDEITIKKKLFNNNSSISTVGNKSVFFKSIQTDKLIEYETIQGNVNVKWNISHLESTKNAKSVLKNIYEVFYSKDSNDDWQLFTTTSNNAGFEWDTTSISEGPDYYAASANSYIQQKITPSTITDVLVTE